MAWLVPVRATVRCPSLAISLPVRRQSADRDPLWLNGCSNGIRCEPAKPVQEWSFECPQVMGTGRPIAMNSNRIAAWLRWAATALLLLGVVVVAYAMRATSSPDALVTATKIAAAAFGLPAAIAYAVAYWIDARGERFEADRARDSDDDHNHPGLGAS